MMTIIEIVCFIFVTVSLGFEGVCVVHGDGGSEQWHHGIHYEGQLLCVDLEYNQSGASETVLVGSATSAFECALQCAAT